MMTDARYLAARTSEYMACPRLSREKERELCLRWRHDRDESARRQLVEANMRHVVAIARRFRRYPIAFGDLMAEGSLGLVIAIDRFDVTRGVRLVTYASYWIRALIFQAIIKEWKRGKTGLGMTRSKTFFKIRRLLALQRARYGDLGTNLGQVAADLDVSMESLQEMLEYLKTYDLSLDGDWTGEDVGRGGLHEKVSAGGPGPDALASRAESRALTRAVIDRAFRCLDEREKLVASTRLMHHQPRTLAELGRRMGVSRERARQIEQRARQKLGRALRREGLTGSSVNAYFG